MRLVEVTIPSGKRDAVLGTLDNEEIDYVVTDEVSGRDYTAVVSFPLPTEAVEPVLDELREAGLSDDSYTIIIDAQTVISRRFDQLRERYEKEEKSPERIAREEIRDRARDLTPNFEAYVFLTITSVIVATAGVLLDSAAIVVGSMVIAPLIGPAMATSVGTVIIDRELFVKGVKFQAVGFALGIVAAALFAGLIQTIHLVPPGIDIVSLGEVRERLAPDFLSLAVALGAGTAGAFSLSTGVSAALVGVMIAAALVPPVAVVGIGIAWSLPEVVIGAFVLALLNFVSINLAALVTLWYQGYRPSRSWFRVGEARHATLQRVAVLIAVIAVLSLFLGWVTYSSYQNATFQDDVQADVTGLLDAQDARLLDIQFEYSGIPPFQEPRTVIVTIGYPINGPPPDLATEIDARVDARAGRDVSVEVRYVIVDRA